MNREHTSTDEGQPIVVVSGLPRSGTSMTMQMLAAGGIAAVTDGIRAPSEDNPRGYFEDERVKRLYQKGEDRSWLSEARGKAIKVISFLLKDLPAEHHYKVLFMKRPLGEVLASQRKMLERRGEADPGSDEKMYELWRAHLRKIDELFARSPHLERLELSYSDVLRDPLGEARRIQAFLGLPLDPEVMAAAVDGTLYRNRAD
jgi:hypothetical protein